ncbi:MAG: hypothetical protein JWM57_3467 [Phycisphaerales bacterium]|nr:hypothetical protein [Phycisphaerales bacterium]
MKLCITRAALGLSLLTAATASAAVVNVDTNTAGSTDGTLIYTSGGQTAAANSAYAVSYTGASNRVVGISGSAGARTVSNFLMAFRLPTLPDGNSITAATLTVYLSGTNTTTPAFNADLWGLGYRNGTASTSILAGTVSGGVSAATGDFADVDADGNPTALPTSSTNVSVQFSDTTDGGAASGIAARQKLADNVLTSATPTSTAVTVSVTSYLQALYAAGAASTAGTTAGFSDGLGMFRLSPDAAINVAVGGNIRYDLFTNNDAGTRSRR